MGYEKWFNQIGVVQYDDLFSQMKAFSEYIFTITMCVLLRALPSSVLNAKYLAFGTPNTKDRPS